MLHNSRHGQRGLTKYTQTHTHTERERVMMTALSHSARIFASYVRFDYRACSRSSQLPPTRFINHSPFSESFQSKHLNVVVAITLH
jgi:hypothetical protein